MGKVSSPTFAAVASAESRSSSSNNSSKKPFWLYCVYILFGLVCWDAFRTYQRQREFVRSALSSSDVDAIQEENTIISYSTGAEEHVISSNYGSSMYGGGIHTARSKAKTTPTRGARMAKLENNVQPKPTDGTLDYNVVQNKKQKKNNDDWSGFSFYVMTDTPYTDWQGKRLRSQMADLRDFLKENPQRNITFGVHLGNTQKVSNSLCLENSYEETSSLIAKGPRPTVVVPGNNDWFDCPFREKSFDLFLKYYGPSFITKWHAEHYDPLGISRSKVNPELFVFYVEGILFVGVHLMHVRAEEESRTSWDKRMKENMDWVASCVETYFPKYPMRGAIILGHAPRTQRTRPFFVSLSNYFVNITSRESLPVMYLHGHGLNWEVDHTFSQDVGWESFVDVQIHQSGLADPVLIDVAPQLKGKVQELREENDMQTTLGGGLFRVDRRQGVYPDPMDIPKRRKRKAE